MPAMIRAPVAASFLREKKADQIWCEAKVLSELLAGNRELPGGDRLAKL